MTDYTPMLSEMSELKTKVDRVILADLLPTSHAVPEIDLLYRMMRDYPLRGGKGMRPFMCVTSCRAFGGTEVDSLLTATSLELFQNWILIHDDIEDSSEMRRGAPALHKKYDWRLALNTGDALHAKMWQALLLNRHHLGDVKTLEILAEFARMINETTEGQQMELGWVVSNRWDLTEDDYYTMCTKKTSWYTATSPMRLGGIAAGASTGSLDDLVGAGTKLGVGFQIHDDVLNLSAGAKYGKQRADDLLEGKRTLILIKLLSLCSPTERARVIDLFSQTREERKEHIGYLLDLISAHGVLDYARKKSYSLVDEALVILNRIEWTGDRSAAKRLEEIARFAIERDW